MDGLIILGVILLIFRAITQKAKQFSENAQKADEHPRKGNDATKHISQTARMAREQQPPRRSAAASPPDGEGSAHYEPITPTVAVDNIYRSYSGSLGNTTREGAASVAAKSGEGDASGEGRDASDASMRNDRIQMSLSLSLQEEQPAMQVLPENWIEEDLVRGFVMSEIFKRPHGWSGWHE